MDKTGNHEVDEFVELISMVDMTELSIMDQLVMAAAYAEMITKVKPILLKHLASKKDGQSFLFKL